jgi:HTH-type transcriptional repressor of NAD biosynthesis genes
MTTRRFQRGLVVGKFCPLHKGHEAVIHRALAECETVVVLSYTVPEFPGCEPEKRTVWLESLFPETTRIVLGADNPWGLVPPPNDDPDESRHRRFVGQVCREVLHTTVDAVFTSESYGDGFAAELTGYFREEVDACHAEVVHVPVDPGRSVSPVSGTALRADPHGLRQWLSPVVYASFVKRICLLGGESSGKSTLAAALAQKYETLHVTEYGRELWVDQGGHLSYEDLLHIGIVQVGREEEAAGRANRYLFCDTSPLTTLFYCLEDHGRAEPELRALAKRKYDSYVLCAPDIPFDQDGTRRDTAFRQQQHDWYEEQLTAMGATWVEVRGDVQERMEQVDACLRQAR